MIFLERNKNAKNLYSFIKLKLRHTVLCTFDDYPTHKHKSSVCVGILELIPEKRYKNTKALYKCKETFEKIELESDEIITVNNRKYIKDIERKNNTIIWQQYNERKAI